MYNYHHLYQHLHYNYTHFHLYNQVHSLDSLEMLEKDFSKKLLKKIVPLVDKVVVSFATRSLGNGQRFRANSIIVCAWT